MERRKGDDPREPAASIGDGYGAKEANGGLPSRPEVQARATRAPTDALEWENKFQPTETGKYPVDVGFIVEIERPRDHDEGWK